MNDDNPPSDLLVDSLAWLMIRDRYGREAAREHAIRSRQERCRIATGHQVRFECNQLPYCELCGCETVEVE